MNLKNDAREIFLAGVRRVDPGRLLRVALSLKGEMLSVSHATGTFVYDLSTYSHIVVAGMGKASAVLALELESLLGSRIDSGFVVTKALSGIVCKRIELAEGGHPVPDERSVAAGHAMLSLAKKVKGFEALGEKTLVIVLISGGGSALLSAPIEGIDLKDKALVTSLLLESGANIQDMNAVRKHLSRIKGGRLAEAFAPAALLSLILSDVVGDDLDSIASGPTVPDRSTWDKAFEILQEKKVWESLPHSIKTVFKEGLAGLRPETPKPDSSIFLNTETVLVGNNMLALSAAEQEAKARGYNTLLLSSRIVGEAREVAMLFPALARDIAQYGVPLVKPACILAGGETTVTLKGKGKGGRNQEMALAFASSLEGLASAPGFSDREMIFLSGGTDGNDGPTDAAGAYASCSTIERARNLNLDIKEYLANNDSYNFFQKTGDLFLTGPTGTNVCDIQVLLVG
jgi:hydroxypyruvate reductase